MTGTQASPSQSGEAHGDLRGFARLETGEPVAHGGLVPVPRSPVSIAEMGYQTQQDGSYRLLLPAETYTIQVFAESASGVPL